MPLPPYLLSVSAFICDHVLREDTGVFSAIRIVDVFYVPRPPQPGIVPFVQAYAMIIFKADPQHHEEHELEFRQISPDGKTKTIGKHAGIKFELFNRSSPEMPGGLTIYAQLNIVRPPGISGLLLLKS